MDSSSFNSLVKNYTCLTEDECSNLANLSNAYPYSQIIRLLYARAANDLKHNDRETSLHAAAAYASDRTVLKQVMTSPQKVRIQSLPPQEAKVQTSAILQEANTQDVKVQETGVKIQETKTQEVKIQEAKNQESAPKVSEVIVVSIEKKEPIPSSSPILKADDITLSGDALREDLFHELEKLQRLTHQFSDQMDEFKNTGEIQTFPAKAKQDIADAGGDPLIEEIKTTKKKLKVVNPKQKEQIEIIDQFIKTKPIIPKPNVEITATDLAEDSGMFNDNIVSETLAEILMRQGKKDKAIEVLKKLIWKFPQKKAYFAAQIESLKS